MLTGTVGRVISIPYFVIFEQQPFIFISNLVSNDFANSKIVNLAVDF